MLIHYLSGGASEWRLARHHLPKDHAQRIKIRANVHVGSPKLLRAGKSRRPDEPADIQRVYLFLGASFFDGKPIKELVDPKIASNVWKRNVQMADEANEPGKFTAFAAYEWTSTPNSSNLHRNIFFKDAAKVPEVPFSSFDS
jgi:hypothetical protein